ncbi:hypothetical protein WA026_019451 [Henosepilachna vigintioctopunctata]|uniref:Uncharacterized protein n=1 Tax=Henosepilachna vigintioctopunctata TaxID=420089 RepID=A0AAW1UCX8_9CUCU
MKNVTILNGAIVRCCEDAIMHKTAINENYSELSVENSYLKKLLKEEEEKNEILIENNNLLKEKLKSLDLNANKKLFSEVISGKSKQQTHQIQNVNKHKKESQTAGIRRTVSNCPATSSGLSIPSNRQENEVLNGTLELPQNKQRNQPQTLTSNLKIQNEPITKQVLSSAIHTRHNGAKCKT